MTQWEYMFVRFYSDEITENGETRKVARNFDWIGYFNELGRQGWELVVANVDPPSGIVARYVFKRPLS